MAQFVKSSQIILINEKIIEESIRIRKTTKIKLPDCIISATAIIKDMTLLSSNESDFGKVIDLGLKFKNPENK